MNAQERLRRKRKKQLQRRLRLMIPITVILVLIVGLTAGGIALSLNQSKQMGKASANGEETAGKDAVGSGEKETKTQSDKTDKSGNASKHTEDAEDATGDGMQESQEEESTEEPTTESESDRAAAEFELLVADIRRKQTADSTTLTALNSAFAGISEQLQIIDASLLSGDNLDMYQVLTDQIAIEEEGAGYAQSAPPAGTRLSDVEGGTTYYDYLLRKLSGTDRDADEIYRLLEVEMNTCFNNISAMTQNDPTVAQMARSLTKSTPDNAYLFGTVTRASDTLQTSLASDGLMNGWAEFGLIRAYQMDETLSDSVKSYLIESTRMTYAMYGIMDITVHKNGGDVSHIADITNRYFGAAGDSFPGTMYQNILENPGRYAAAGLGYLELVNIETTLRENTANYGEDVLLDFLFNRGPATFRVYWEWLQPK